MDKKNPKCENCQKGLSSIDKYFRRKGKRLIEVCSVCYKLSTVVPPSKK